MDRKILSTAPCSYFRGFSWREHEIFDHYASLFIWTLLSHLLLLTFYINGRCHFNPGGIEVSKILVPLRLVKTCGWVE